MLFYEFFGALVKSCTHSHAQCGTGMLLLLTKILIKGDRVYLNGRESPKIPDTEPASLN